MANSRTPEEVRKDYIASMGPELGELFHALYLELTWVHLRWRQFRILFGTSAHRVDLLNQAAPFFFRVVQDVFFEDTLLAIARLVGPAESVRKPNLAIARLPPLLPNPAFRQALESQVAAAQKVGQFAIDWRNRRLAHRDLLLAIGAPAQALSPASRQDVEHALEALRDVLNRIESEFRHSTNAYDFASVVYDAESLLHVLRDGLMRQRERQARWDKGELHDDDIHPPEAV